MKIIGLLILSFYFCSHSEVPKQYILIDSVITPNEFTVLKEHPKLYQFFQYSVIDFKEMNSIITKAKKTEVFKTKQTNTPIKVSSYTTTDFTGKPFWGDQQVVPYKEIHHIEIFSDFKWGRYINSIVSGALLGLSFGAIFEIPRFSYGEASWVGPAMFAGLGTVFGLANEDAMRDKVIIQFNTEF